MRYRATIIDGAPAVRGAVCDLVHLDEVGNLLDRPAQLRLVLDTSIGDRYVDLCGGHETAVGVDLARWSHPLTAAQCVHEGRLDGVLTEVLSRSLRDAA